MCAIWSSYLGIFYKIDISDFSSKCFNSYKDLIIYVRCENKHLVIYVRCENFNFSLEFKHQSSDKCAVMVLIVLSAT